MVPYGLPEISKTAGELQAAGLELYDLVLNPFFTAGSRLTVIAAAVRHLLIPSVVILGALGSGHTVFSLC